MASVHPHAQSFPIHRVPMTRPLVWLRGGWDDLMHNPGASLAYGWLVSALGALILAYQRHPLFIAVAIIGFLLVGPILSAGLCELSRRRDRGESATFQSSLRPLRRNDRSLLGVAEALGLVALIWFLLSGAVFYALAGSLGPSPQSTVWGDVMAQLSSAQYTAYILAGALLACAVFALAVVAVPMIVDRHVDAATAMRKSLRVMARDLPAMLVWALLIVLLVTVGFATWLLGMIVIYPLLGHATWRAYRELVD